MNIPETAMMMPEAESNLFYAQNNLLSPSNFPLGNGNAFWVRSDEEAHFGNGDGISPMVALDIVAHEITHGVIQKTSILLGSTEARAINESFCDIFGCNVEYYVNDVRNLTNHSDYQIGELCSSGTLRSLSDPTLYGGARVYLGPNWDFGNTGTAPYTNAGIQNYCFFLLVNGSNNHPVENGSHVCALGRRKTSMIAYQAMVSYSWSSMDYNDARKAWIWAAEDIFGVNSFEATQCKNAWSAVGVGQPGDPCVFSGLLNETETSNFQLYPNPSTGVLCFSTPKEKQEYIIRIFSVSGDLILEKNNESTLDCISVKSLPQGLYFASIVSNNFSETHKFIKIN